MMNIKKIFIATILLAMGLSSCLYEHAGVDPIIPPVDTTSNIPIDNVTLNCNQNQTNNTLDSVCFNTEILPFFVTNCAQSGCHDSKTRADGYDLSSYQKITSRGIDLKNPSRSKVYTEMLSEMPPKPAARIPKAKTDRILKWITEGAKNVNCNTAVDTTNVTFSKTVLPLLETNCVGCHKSGSASGSVLLDTYAHVKIYVDNKKIWGSMNYSPGYIAMPPTQKLNDCQLKVVQKWIAAGAKND